jgi:hypothetical protein
MHLLTEQRIKALEHQLGLITCEHETIKIRYRETSIGTKMYKRQCIRCGEMVGNWIPHTTIGSTNIDPIDDGLAANYRKTKFELEKAISDLILEHKNNDRNEWYKEYLSSPEWRAKRRLVFDRCNWVCEGCGRSSTEVAHHTTYKNVGNEFLFELVGLCRNCHDSYHDKEHGDE